MITDALLAYRHELRQDIIEDQTDDFSTFLGHLADQLIFNAFTQEAVRRRSQGKPEDNAPIVEVICMCCVCPNDNSVEVFNHLFILHYHQVVRTHCAKKLSTLPSYKPEDQLRCRSCHQKCSYFCDLCSILSSDVSSKNIISAFCNPITKPCFKEHIESMSIGADGDY